MTDLARLHINQLSPANGVYAKPAIVLELQLETRAGSPLGGEPLIDPLGLDPVSVD